MIPRDTNLHGTNFGGVLLSYIDQVGSVGAAYEFVTTVGPISRP